MRAEEDSERLRMRLSKHPGDAQNDTFRAPDLRANSRKSRFFKGTGEIKIGGQAIAAQHAENRNVRKEKEV